MGIVCMAIEMPAICSATRLLSFISLRWTVPYYALVESLER